jgi:outer membrane immunogenic protein
MRNSKLIISAAVAVSAIVGIGAASAADLAARTYTKAPPIVAPAYNWTGFYVGLNAGGGFGRNGAFETGLPLNGAQVLNYGLGNNASGGFGGVQAGYNWQLSNWVWGVEADIQGANIKGSATVNNIGSVGGPVVPGSFATASENIDYFGTARVRAGFLATPALLLYGTGGLAWADVKTNGQVFSPFIPSPYLSSGTTIRAGWTAGVGAEYKVTANWSVKGEWLYYDVGHVTNITNSLAAFYSQFDYAIRGNLVRVGVNYEFGGPVVAKY